MTAFLDLGASLIGLALRQFYPCIDRIGITYRCFSDASSARLRIDDRTRVDRYLRSPK